jgi:hypothetical protein
MRAALLFQGVSLLVGVFSVPIFLRYLSPADFLLWMIFTTIGGLTLQIESALQNISVRRIASEVVSANFFAARKEVERAATLYRTLSLSVVLLVMPCGFLFVANQDNHHFSQFWNIAWLIFGCAYAFNFLFGPNNCLLLATNATNSFNYINALTRALNFVGAFLLLSLGYAVVGAAVSFLFSVVVGCFMIKWQGRQRLIAAVTSGEPPVPTDTSCPSASGPLTDVAHFSLFTFAAYWLYRGALLVATPFFSSGEMSSYGLTLTALSVVNAIALIPNQIRLGTMVTAVVGDRQDDIQAQIAFGLVFATVTFSGFFGVLAVAGPSLLALVGSEVSLPSSSQLAMVFGAFLVESWIMVLVNVLVIRKSYDFVTWYCSTVVIAFIVGLVTALSTGALYIGLALIPAMLQLLFTLPAVFCSCARSCGQNWQAFSLNVLMHCSRLVRSRVA